MISSYESCDDDYYRKIYEKRNIWFNTNWGPCAVEFEKKSCLVFLYQILQMRTRKETHVLISKRQIQHPSSTISPKPAGTSNTFFTRFGQTLWFKRLRTAVVRWIWNGNSAKSVQKQIVDRAGGKSVTQPKKPMPGFFTFLYKNVPVCCETKYFR